MFIKERGCGLPSEVVRDSLENVSSYLRGAAPRLKAPSVFLLPGWLEAWWRVFGSGAELYLHTVRLDGEIIGIAPLLRSGRTTSFIGSPDLCDYLDFIVVPGAEREFFTGLLRFLEREGVAQLDLHSLRPDSAAFRYLAGEEGRGGGSAGPLIEREEVSLELDLPAGWEAYLASLSKKQRHEVRRKLRRLEEAGQPRYFTVEDRDALKDYWPLFFKLFAESRPDKAGFLNPARKEFFPAAVEAAAGCGLAKLGVLELDGLPAAMVLCFDYRGVYYLYNSAYDPAFAPLSAGLMAKVYCIREAVELGRRRFDFLKGGEPYKYRLGGREIPVFHCRVPTAGPVCCARPPRACEEGI
jgi:CelD/BcsL family acetyltransferase involved in cellulose biosynthesis